MFFSGLQYIHELNIVHLDIKPYNILFSNKVSFHGFIYGRTRRDFFLGQTVMIVLFRSSKSRIRYFLLSFYQILNCSCTSGINLKSPSLIIRCKKVRDPKKYGPIRPKTAITGYSFLNIFFLPWGAMVQMTIKAVRRTPISSS